MRTQIIGLAAAVALMVGGCVTVPITSQNPTCYRAGYRGFTGPQGDAICRAEWASGRAAARKAWAEQGWGSDIAVDWQSILGRR